MVQNKKKVYLWFIVAGALLSAYAGYLLNGAWEPGMEMNAFLESFNRVCAEPFANYYNETTLKAVVIALIVYATVLLMYITSQRNFMPGKEFGTARFESSKTANKILADKNENFNRILSQNVKMSLNFRRLKLNGNILICGGSGAGKTDMGRRKRLLMKIRRGDILYADLGVQYQGSMQGGMRPVVVVSNNRANKHSTVITVVPLSTKIYKKRSLPTHVFISSYKTEGLDQHSVALCEQVTALNFDRIIEHMGKVDKETLDRITEGVQVQVGVFDRYN